MNRYRTRSRAQPGMEVAKGTAMETPPQPPRSPRARRTTTPPPAAPRPRRRSAKTVLAAEAAPATVEAPSHDQIARRAYEISQSRPAGTGDPLADWLQAERELTAVPS